MRELEEHIILLLTVVKGIPRQI